MLNIKYLDVMMRRALLCFVMMFSMGQLSYGLEPGASRNEFLFENSSGWKGVTASSSTNSNEAYLQAKGRLMLQDGTDVQDKLELFNLLFVGTIQAFSLPPSEIPTGWIICDGTEYDVTVEGNEKLEGLYNILGGSNGTFHAPDLRNRFLMGISESETMLANGDATQTSHTHTFSSAHSHNVTETEHNHKIASNKPFPTTSSTGGGLDKGGGGSRFMIPQVIEIDAGSSGVGVANATIELSVTLPTAAGARAISLDTVVPKHVGVIYAIKY